MGRFWGGINIPPQPPVLRSSWKKGGSINYVGPSKTFKYIGNVNC